MYLESSSVDSPFPQRLVRPTTAEKPWLYCRSETKSPLQPGTSTRATRKEREGFVRPSYCLPSAQPCTVTGVALGRCCTGPERSCLPQLGASLAPPCQPAHESTQTQINFKQVRRIPRRVMRKDRNAHAHPHLSGSDHPPSPSSLFPGKRAIRPSECERGVSGQGRARAEEADRNPDRQTGRQAASPASSPMGRAALSQPRGNKALCVQDEASSQQWTCCAYVCVLRP